MSRLNSRTMAFFAALALLSLTPAGASGDNLCAKARYSEVNSVVRGSGDPSFEKDCFESYLPSAGLLMLEVTVPDAAQIEPRLDFLGRQCDGREGHRESFEYQARLANSALVEVRGAGNYLFCVTAQDPAETLDDFKLVNGFVAMGPEKGDPDESEPEPDPLVGTAGFEKGDPDESEPEPDPLVDPSGGGIRSIAKIKPGLEKGDPDESEPEPDPLVGSAGFDKGDPDESEPEPDPLVAGPLAELRRICGQTRADDHGDTLHCATPIALGWAVRAEVGNDWGDDADLFAFTVDELTSVLIETTGVTDTAGGLYDANGYRLRAAGGGGSGENFRIVKTLSPGRYFVRVAGGAGAEGPYDLTVEELVADD